MARRLYALIFEGFEMLDLYGPLETLQDAADIVAAADGTGPVAASGGPRTLPEAARGVVTPGSDGILLIPGGAGTPALVDHGPLLAAIALLAGTAGMTASVCTGAALLARTGLLDGRKATSNKRAVDWVRSQGPAVDWQPTARWVEARANRVEYRWARDPADDPFAVA